MKTFTEKVREFYKKEKGVDIDGVEFMDAPYDLEQYNFDNITGNINLMAGRIITPKEADDIIGSFMTAPLP